MNEQKNAQGAHVRHGGRHHLESAETPKLSHAAHTPGPWRWEVNHKSRQIKLCGGRPRFDLTVMDFVRWGMGGAQPRLLRPMIGSSMMLLEHATRYAEIVPGREHHANWFQTLNHPDANLIAAAPELLDALKVVVGSAFPSETQHPAMWKAWKIAEVAIAKAEGRS